MNVLQVVVWVVCDREAVNHPQVNLYNLSGCSKVFA